MLKIHLSLKKIPLFFLCTLSILTLIYGISIFLRFRFGYGGILLSIFDLGTDSSVPTWYASLSLLCCSFLCSLIAVKTKQAGEKYFWHWAILALIFCLMSIDEVAMIHETLGSWLDHHLPATRKGAFYYSWVILAIPLVFIFLLSYLRFVMQLPKMSKRFFILALVTLIAGGLGVEMIGANYDSQNESADLALSLLVIVEEFLEMVGVFFFICALTSYIYKQFKRVQILIE